MIFIFVKHFRLRNNFYSSDPPRTWPRRASKNICIKIDAEYYCRGVRECVARVENLRILLSFVMDRGSHSLLGAASTSWRVKQSGRERKNDAKGCVS